MSWIFWGTAAGGWCVAACVWLFLSARAARRETARALHLRATVEPYLLRRTQELGLPSPAAASSDDRLDDIVDLVCTLAAQLTSREKDLTGLSDTQRMAVARTLPIRRSDLED